MVSKFFTNHIAQFFLRFRNRHFFIVDFTLLCILPLFALALRVDNPFDPMYSSPLLVFTVVQLPIWLGVMLVSGMYSRYWQYASLDEVGIILKSMTLALLASGLLFFLVLRPLNWIPESFPRSVPLLTGLLALLFIGGSRLSVRFMDRLQRQSPTPAHKPKAVMVFGAGHAGAMIVREMQGNPQLGLNPVAFLDDDERKHHSFIFGVPVVGGRSAIKTVARDFNVQQAIIAMPTAPGKTIREIAALCLEANLGVKTVPGIFELLDGSVTVNKLREVDIDDLLRREPVAHETGAVVEMLRGKRILITGAGGSIGSELCRQIARSAPAQMILLGHGENSLFASNNEFTDAYPQIEFVSVVGDVRDAPRMQSVLARYRPELVFHAAAHKHVSLMETNVEDAVTNNVLGTRVMLDAAMEQDVETFVMISTDKAVNPVSVMGATKRVAELYVHARALETGKRFVAVRFGNVLGSRGSVVPLFKQQIANGGPVKVTHPDVKRFFMTIPEAVQLVLQAATLGKGGEIFALDMGEPVRIVDLAHDLIRLSGLQVGRDIDIEFTGLRPGEKLYEELFVSGERYERTPREKIFVARNGARPSASEHANLYAAMEELIQCAQRGDADAVRARLTALTGLGQNAGGSASEHAAFVS